MMQRLFLPAAAFLLTLGVASGAKASPNEHLNWGQNLAASQTACPAGTAIVDVNQKVLNDVDSGVGGNYWAYDDIVRHISVMDLGAGNYCATVSYQGSFETIAGTSPGATGVVADGVVGTFQGGYTATFTATFSPTIKTRGSIGTFDYHCDQSGTCPNLVDWTTLFFTGVTNFQQPWWGWVYHAGNNGGWVNAANGNSGDITGQ